MMAAGAAILHADLDAFYASVEQRDHPRLRGRPVIVGGGGVVLAASYEAKRMGVRTAMPGRAAREVCPGAVVMPPRFEVYTEASRAVFDIFHDTSPWVEGLSIDEAFLDVSGLGRLSGRPIEIAARLRSRVADDVGLPITVGVASTKFLAKVASGVGKPDGLLEVPAGAELDFLHPLDVRALWGVGPVTAGKLADRGIHTVGEVARLGDGALVALLGPAAGHHLHALAHNLDPRQVQTGVRRRSIGSQRSLGRRQRTWTELDEMLLSIVDRVTARLRAAERVGRTIVLRLRDSDLRKSTRSHTVPEATASTQTVLGVARRLLADARPDIEHRGITLLGLSIANLSDADAVQMALPFDKRDRPELDRTVDAIHDRFGKEALARTALLHHDPGMSMPMLPD